MKRVYTIRNIEHKPGTNVFVLKDEDGNLKQNIRKGKFFFWKTKNWRLDIHLRQTLIMNGAQNMNIWICIYR